MKHVVFIFSLVVIVFMMALLIINHQEKVPMRLLSVQKYYSYLYEEGIEMKVSLYVNDIDHPIAYALSYDKIELMNADESKKLEMSLDKITLGYEESYLNETYHEMTIHMFLPDLGENYVIEDLFMHMVLLDGQDYLISLGTLSLMSISSDTNALDWTALEGHKAPDLFISRLGIINIEYLNLEQPIEQIRIGIDYSISFETQSEKIILTIPDEDMLLDDVPIVIYFSDGAIQTIANFKYMFDYEILKESGLLITTYALN
ncbi:MAG: hypothetical protein KKH01_04205 [Firmicutes bacterium]|nr:hypothetical protein [Bacillota bacterium]